MEDLKIILILGLPGSGKTTYSNFLKDKMPHSLLLDDYSVKFPNGIEIPSDKKTLIVTDPMFLTFSYETITTYFIKRYPEYRISFEWVIFSLDVVSCLKNVNARNDGRIISHYFMNSLYKKSKDHINDYINSIMLHNEYLDIRESFK